MKKNIILLIIFLFLGGFSFGNSLFEKVSENHEYIEIGSGKISISKSYYSNKGNKYLIVGNLSYYKLSSEEEYNQFKRSGKISSDSLFFSGFKNGISLLKREGESVQERDCKLLTRKKKLLFDALKEKNLVKVQDENILGRINDYAECYYSDSSEIFLAFDEIASSDAEYVFRNGEKLYDKFSVFEKKFVDLSQKKLLKKIYSYVINKTDYNYSFTESLGDSQDFSKEPWKISSFFEGEKVVCDVYVKIFAIMVEFMGIEVEKIEGNLQPVEENVLSRSNFGHSWLKLKGKDVYFDPTFDDSKGKESLKYFAKSKKCFTLEHKFPDGKTLKNEKERRKYISSNFAHLSYECPSLLNKAIIKNGNIIKMLKTLFINKNTQEIKNFLCQHIDICIKEEMTDKKELLESLKKYVVKVNEKEYNFSEELDDFDVFKKDFSSLTRKQKEYIERLSSKLFSLLKQKSNEQRKEVFGNIKSKLEKTLNQKNLGTTKEIMIKYLNHLFVVEKLK